METHTRQEEGPENTMALSAAFLVYLTNINEVNETEIQRSVGKAQ